MKRKTTLIAASAAVVAAASAALVAGNALAEDTDPTGDVGATIIGGHDATEDYGFIASVQWEANGDPNAHHCGATLIAPQWIVTAGHCAVDADGNPKDPAPIHIRIGTNDRTDGGQDIQVDQVVPHPDYLTDPYPNGNDLALMHLAEAAEQTPIAIADPVDPGTEVRELGWGTIVAEETVLPTYLQELDSVVLADSACDFGDEWSWTPGDVCVDTPNDDSGACYGDSGSPLVVRDAAGEWAVLGADSRAGGTGCLATDEVYTSVPAHRDWIDGLIG